MMINRLGHRNRRFPLPFTAAASILVATFLFVPAEAGQGPYELRATLIVYPLIIFGAQAVNPVCILHYPLLVFAEVVSRMWGMPWAVRIPASVIGIVLIT